MLHDGIHEGIISETDWEMAHQKREKTGVKYEKIHSLQHEHILSGILRCPLCGSGMYGNVNRKKKKDGTLYKDYFYYACKHRRLVDGHKCGYRKQWSEEKINNAVEEVIRKLVKNPKFEEAIMNKIGSRIDTEEIEKEIEGLEKQHRQLTGAKARLGQQMDSLDIMDKFYEKKYQDMETRLYRLYDEIEGVENSIEEVKNRLLNIRQQKISEENVYQFLLYFDKLYDKFTDLEKKDFVETTKVPLTDAGDYRLASFVDEQRMCRLYEKFILEYYTRHYPALSVSASQIPWSLDDGVGTMLPVMQSDIHLQRGNTVLIIDAKYYSHTTQVQFDKHTLHSNNLYQIFTYVKTAAINLEKKRIQFRVCFFTRRRKKKSNRTMYIRCMAVR